MPAGVAAWERGPRPSAGRLLEWFPFPGGSLQRAQGLKGRLCLRVPLIPPGSNVHTSA